jgi:hypothetical protein
MPNFASALTSSTTERMEKMRLAPSNGFSRLN